MRETTESKTRYVRDLEETPEGIQSEVANLTKGLYSEDSDERKEATANLKRIAEYHPNDVITTCDKVRNLAKTDKRWIQSDSLVILRFVGEENPDEIRTIIGTSISLLYNENAKIREVATRLLVVAIDQYPEKVRPAIPRLIEMLDDPNELPRGPAAQAIARLAHYHPDDIKSKNVITQLEQMADPDFEENKRGPDMLDEQIKYAKNALENIKKSVRQKDAQLPESILDDELRTRVAEHFENRQYQSAVQQAFITLEERVRNKGGYTHEDHGYSLMSEAFHYDNGPLAFGKTKSERRGVMMLYQSAFQTFRNPSSHRFLDNTDTRHAYNIICFVNLLIIMLGSPSG